MPGAPNFEEWVDTFVKTIDVTGPESEVDNWFNQILIDDEYDSCGSGRWAGVLVDGSFRFSGASSDGLPYFRKVCNTRGVCEL